MLTAEEAGAAPVSALDSGALSRVGWLGQLGGLLSATPPVTVARAGDTSEHEPRPCLPAAVPREGKNRHGCRCRKNDLGSACASGVLLLGGFIRKLLGLDLYFQASFSSHPPFLSLHSLLQGLQNLWSDPSLTFPELVNQAACPRPQRCSSKLRQTGCLLGGWADDVG